MKLIKLTRLLWKKIMPKCKPEDLARAIIGEFPRIHEDTDPFRVLVSTILSQRTRDENTEEASRKLFEKYPDIDSIASANPEDLYELIRVSGMYRQKAEKIVLVSRIVKKNYYGKVPDNLDELVALPGVGRKTANIVLNIGFGIPAMSVDTHVHRISNRLGWVRTKTPLKTEEALVEILPSDVWGPLNGSMVEFGRAVCRPIKPYCEKCSFSSCCEYFNSSRNDRQP